MVSIQFRVTNNKRRFMSGTPYSLSLRDNLQTAFAKKSGSFTNMNGAQLSEELGKLLANDASQQQLSRNENPYLLRDTLVRGQPVSWILQDRERAKDILGKVDQLQEAFKQRLLDPRISNIFSDQGSFEGLGMRKVLIVLGKENLADAGEIGDESIEKLQPLGKDFIQQAQDVFKDLSEVHLESFARWIHGLKTNNAIVKAQEQGIEDGRVHWAEIPRYDRQEILEEQFSRIPLIFRMKVQGLNRGLINNQNFLDSLLPEAVIHLFHEDLSPSTIAPRFSSDKALNFVGNPLSISGSQYESTPVYQFENPGDFIFLTGLFAQALGGLTLERTSSAIHGVMIGKKNIERISTVHQLCVNRPDAGPVVDFLGQEISSDTWEQFSNKLEEAPWPKVEAINTVIQLIVKDIPRIGDFISPKFVISTKQLKIIGKYFKRFLEEN